METYNSNYHADRQDERIIKKIFPIINKWKVLEGEQIIIHFKTYIRKKCEVNNKYYLIPVQRKHYFFFEHYSEEIENEKLLDFFVFCHTAQIGTKIDPKNSIFMLDENIMDEADRLTYHYENKAIIINN